MIIELAERNLFLTNLNKNKGDNTINTHIAWCKFMKIIFSGSNLAKISSIQIFRLLIYISMVLIICYIRYATTKIVREIGKKAFHVSDISWS